MILHDSDAMLSRNETAKALTTAGYKVTKKTLDTKACRGGGPPYSVFGKHALYRWGAALAWAQAHASSPVATAAEHRAARRTVAASSTLNT